MLTDYQQYLENRYAAELEAARKSRNAAAAAYKNYAIAGVQALLNFDLWREQVDLDKFYKFDAMARVINERLTQWDAWIAWLENAPVDEVIDYLECQMTAQIEDAA